MMKRRDMEEAIRKMGIHVTNCLDARAAGINAFTEYFLSSIQSSPDEFSQFVSDSRNKFIDKLIQEGVTHASSPPKITHRIWLTSDESPVLPPDDVVAKIESHSKEIAPDYLNILWTNSDLVKETLSGRFKDRCVPILCASISGFSSDPLFDRIVRLIQCRKYVLAADFLRIVLLKRIGGIYSDLGVQFNKNFLCIAHSAKYTLFLGDGLFFQTSLLAAPQGADLINLFYGILCNPEVLPKSWVTNSETINAQHEVNVFAGPAFTAICYLFASPDDRIFTCTRDGENIHWQSSGSWYGKEPKYGNVLVPSSDVSILDKNKFVYYENCHNENLETFNVPPMLAAKLKILINLSSYFHDEPTRLCRIMCFQGSDKVASWHNYTYFYNFLLPQVRESGDSLLEIGINASILDVESSMGVTCVPSASLKGWREFFEMSDVYGADIDRQILLRESGVSTHCVSQLERNNIEQLWASIGSNGDVSIVLDAGLHTFEANTNVYEGTVERNPSLKLFIVEDVLVGYVESWVGYLKNQKMPSAILKIPNPRNTSDNILVLVFTEPK